MTSMVQSVETVRASADQYLQLLSQIRTAIAQRNHRAVERAARDLRSHVREGSSKGAFEAAWQLEMMGRRGDLARAHQISTALEEILLGRSAAPDEWRTDQ